MKNRRTGLIVIVAACALSFACVGTYQRVYSPPPPPAPAPPPGAQDQPFYSDLAPYGDWVYVSGPGWVWQPYNMPADWQPYQQGHWVLTDYGWTWASDEEFGWAVYHYGRWTNDGAYGWVWVPGTEWGPAWVAWHEGAGYVGWAPLPWQVSWQAGIGLDWGGVNVSVALGPSAWHFVPAGAMVDPGCRRYIVPVAQNTTLIQRTSNVTNYTYIDNRVVNQSVRVDTIGRAVGHPVQRYHLEQADSPERGRGGVQGDSFVVFRPDPERVMHSNRRDVPPGHDGSRPASEHHGPDNPWGVAHGHDRGMRGMTQEPATPAPPSGTPGGSQASQQGSQDGTRSNGQQGPPPQSNRDAAHDAHGQRDMERMHPWMQPANQPPANPPAAGGNAPAAQVNPPAGPGNSSNAPGHSSHDGRGNSSHDGNGSATPGSPAPGNPAPGNSAPATNSSRPAPPATPGATSSSQGQGNGQSHDKTPPGKSQGKGQADNGNKHDKPKPAPPADSSDKDKPKQNS